MSRRPIIVGIRSNEDGDAGEPEISSRFREAMSRFPAGVTVVAVRDEDEVAAITVSAFTSVSVDPPLVLVCLGLNASVLPYVSEIRRFTVNILGESGRTAASWFSQQTPEDASRFTDGDPVLRGAVATFVCSLEAMHPGGDHRIVVGRVERVVEGDDEPPLIYHAREYRGLA